MAITLNGTTGISSPGGDTSTSLATTNLSYTGTLTGGTGVIAIGTNQIYKDASGNVGLGVTPSVRLNVQAATANATVANFSGSNSGRGLTIKTFQSVGGDDCGVDFSAFASPYGSFKWTQSASTVMTLDASGNLNIGNTSNAGAPLQVQVARTLSTNATAIILSDLAVGVQTNGVYKSIRSLSNNNNSVSEIRFLETDGTNNNTGIAFATQAVAGGLTERARIDYSGNLLVGTNNAAASAGIGVKLRSFGSLYIVNDGSADGINYYNTAAAAYRFYVDATGRIYATYTTISAVSDQRLKENIRDLDDGLSTILALKPRKFDWKEGKGKDIKDDRGFIAQEFEQVFPDMIDTWKDPAPEGEEPYKAVRPDLIPVLVKAIQELTTRLEALEAQ